MNSINIFDKNLFTLIYFQSPFIILMAFFILGLISIILCPKEIRIIKINSSNGIIDVGFLSSYNWSFIQPIVVPISLFVVVSLYQNLTKLINNLINTQIILSKSSSDNIYETVSSSICSSDYLWMIILLFTSFILNLFDFLSYYTDKETSENTKVKDWTVAFQEWNDYKISKWKNLLFDFLMYLQQWFISFVCFVFLYKILKLIFIFNRIFRNNDANIAFNIDYLDVYHQYGFWGLNSIIFYLLIILFLVLFYFMVIRFVHVNRNINWKFFPRYLSYAIILILAIGTFSLYNLINLNLEECRNEKITEFLINKNEIVEKIEVAKISEIDFFKYNELIKSLDSNISQVLSQDIIQSDNKLYYLFFALYIVQIRLILFPPKSILEAIKNVLSKES